MADDLSAMIQRVSGQPADVVDELMRDAGLTTTPRYTVRTIERGTDYTVGYHVTGDKREARTLAAELAAHRFPGARFRWDGDCRMAFRDGAHLGDVSVEPYEGGE